MFFPRVACVCTYVFLGLLLKHSFGKVLAALWLLSVLWAALWLLWRLRGCCCRCSRCSVASWPTRGSSLHVCFFLTLFKGRHGDRQVTGDRGQTDSVQTPDRKGPDIQARMYFSTPTSSVHFHLCFSVGPCSFAYLFKAAEIVKYVSISFIVAGS